MTCADCGFEHSETGACPHCGYDPKVDLMAAVRLPNPPIGNPLEAAFAKICKEANEGKVPQEKAQAHWRTLNDQARDGNLDARHAIARVMLAQKNYPVAHKILAPLAQQGHALAQLDLGKAHEEGLGVEPDVFAAIKFYRLAAAQGNPIALFLLARQHLPDGVLHTDPAAANALMQELATVHPTLFRKTGGCQCQQQNPISDAEFAQKTAGQMAKMVKYALIALVIIVIIAIIKSEL